ncbi:MAG: hypothetical protein M1818_003504 [Claussenomyces sp. TS43310]|nr:MAG: hypothetical protein M1818_003504 [Claussenomyces sp. TS43310]
MPFPSIWSNLRAGLPPKPTLTEQNLSNQAGKVFIVTGSSSGVGKELARILYSHDAKVYVAARSEEKATRAIDEIKAAFPESKGSLIYLHLDLDDLTTIKKSAEEFLAREDKLDVLWNNAGVMIPPQGSKTKQGYELQLGTNCVAPFLFTKLLTPLLVKTAKSAPAGSVRVVWTASSATELMSPNNGLEFDNFDYKREKAPFFKYGTSKAGNYYHGTEYAKRYAKDGIVSVALNPGNLLTDLQRHISGLQLMVMKTFLYHPRFGAYTELFAGLSPDVTLAKTGSWIQPWGRFDGIRSDLAAGAKSESEGGTGYAKKFWEWTEEQIKPYE